jgi:isoleucyl-tRNA synthetase
VGLFSKNAFKHVIVTGNLMGSDGFKLSKSRGNFTDPNALMDKYSADSWRLLLLSCPVMNGEDFTLLDKDVGDTARKLSMIWNMYDFFTMYAEVDGWEWNDDMSDPSEELKNPLDQWIVSRVHELNEEIQRHMDAYDIPSATKPILPFIEDASNWYVRRSRRRFWKTEATSDKNDAYRTLHYVLVHLAQVIAPFTPFLAEELYQKLTGGESVHLLDWPVAGQVNELVVKEMAAVRSAINDGLSKRAQARIKVRQPLKSVTLVSTISSAVSDELNRELLEIAKDELNVKEVLVATGSEYDGSPSSSAEFDLEITPALKREGLMREVIRHVQNARKDAGLNVDDRILLSLQTDDDELQKAIEEHREAIVAETLASVIVEDEFTYKTDVRVERVTLTISLRKSA